MATYMNHGDVETSGAAIILLMMACPTMVWQLS